LKPRLAAAYLNRALVYERLGDSVRSRDDLAQARQLDASLTGPAGSRRP
jgi:hypothetical protein